MQELILEGLPLKWQGVSVNAHGREISRPYEALLSNRFANLRKCGQTCETRQLDKLAICQVSSSSDAWSCQHIDPFPDPSAEFTPRPQQKIAPPPTFRISS
jgi:hypothetical protein